MDGQYLAFVDYIGKTSDGKYQYRFDYTEDTEVVWGDYFNIVPSVLVPNLQPERNCLSYSEVGTFSSSLSLAKNNGCFSMQDCIDGIIALCFSEINEKTIYYHDEPFYLSFGEPLDSVRNKLTESGFVLNGLEQINKGDETVIDNLINSLDSDDNGE